MLKSEHRCSAWTGRLRLSILFLLSAPSIKKLAWGPRYLSGLLDEKATNNYHLLCARYWTCDDQEKQKLCPHGANSLIKAGQLCRGQLTIMTAWTISCINALPHGAPCPWTALEWCWVTPSFLIAASLQTSCSPTNCRDKIITVEKLKHKEKIFLLGAFSVSFP